MTDNLKDRNAVITGGASGIGLAIADRFLKHGVKTCIILDLDETKGKAAVANLTATHGKNRVMFMKCDVMKDMETIPRMVIDMCKTVDILVNNAGICNETQWKRCLEVNICALTGLTLRLMEHMRKDKGGRGGTIINISSIYGYRIEPYMPVYHASKFAIMGLTRSLGHPVNCKKTGVRIVAVCPGLTDTNMSQGCVAWDPADAAGLAEVLAQLPLQKAGDVADATVDICKRAETGTAWCIEGGTIDKVV